MCGKVSTKDITSSLGHSSYEKPSLKSAYNHWMDFTNKQTTENGLMEENNLDRRSNAGKNPNPLLKHIILLTVTT